VCKALWLALRSGCGKLTHVDVRPHADPRKLVGSIRCESYNDHRRVRYEIGYRSVPRNVRRHKLQPSETHSLSVSMNAPGNQLETEKGFA
jgi:hypothetical protein